MSQHVANDAFAACGSGPFLGTIKIIGPKYAFISCDVIYRHFNKDVFVFLNLMAQGCQVGSRVSFILTVSDKGEPQGDNIELLPPPGACANPQQQMMPQPMMQNVPQIPNMQPQMRGGMPQQGGPRPSPMMGQNMNQQQPMGQRKMAERMTIYKGRVKVVHEKGHAFVECHAVSKKYDRDVYFDAEELEFGQLCVGKEVYFVLRHNQKNQPVGQIVPPHGAFVGTLKEYNVDKGFGFVECSDSHRLFDTDVFIHKNEVDLMNAAIGDEVTFAVQLNAKGQPQAISFKVHIGRVKKKNRFTFLECPEVKKDHGKDVFVLDEGDQFEEGQMVQFNLSFSENMEPQAVGCILADGSIPFPNFQDQGKPAAPAPSPDQTFEGTVKSLGPKFGFIDSPAAKEMYGRDVFLNQFAQQQEALTLGDAVVFTMQLNAQGNPQVMEMKKRSGNFHEDESALKKQRLS